MDTDDETFSDSEISLKSLTDPQELEDICNNDDADHNVSLKLYQSLRTELEEIRIIVLSPGRGDEELECRLNYLPLKFAGWRSYETVSYRWAEQYDYVRVTGVALRVPFSAKEALYQLRYPDRERYLWIDCICLDQSNDVEKNHEIARMHHVYKNGTRNLVWLGKDDDTVEEAFELCKLLRKKFEDEAERKGGLYDLVARLRDQHVVANSGVIDFKLQSLLSLFQRPLFKRLWVLQEISLSSENLVVCGHHELPLITIHRAACWLKYNQNLIRLPIIWWASDAMDAMDLCYYGDPECSRFTEELAKDSYQPLIWPSLLWAQQRFNVENPRDRIYALLGVYQHYSGAQSLHKFLQPDQALSLMEVYRNATRFAIANSSQLGILHRVRRHCRWQHDEDGHEWPSWVPCWHHPRESTLDEREMASIFCTGNKHRAAIVSDPGTSLNELQLGGFFLDGPHRCQVQDLSRVLLDATSDQTLSFLNNVFCMAQVLARDALEDIHPIVAATLMAGRNAEQIPLSRADCGGLRILLNFLEKSQGKMPPSHYVRPELDESTLQASRFYYAMFDASFRRRFFITKNGKMGLGPQTMEAGDIVVVLWGGGLPYILRPLERECTYELVGCCYVHGIMHGEAAGEHIALGRPNETFSIF